MFGFSMILRTIVFLGFFIIININNISYSSDIKRENRLYSEIVDSIIDGDPVWFEKANHKFLGIYTKTEAEQVKGDILILHGRGLHPDWQDVIGPLRVGLTDHGWNTLSIQLPVLPKQSTYYDYLGTFPDAVQRINLALAYLKNKNSKKTIMIAHSCGFHMANTWLKYNSPGNLSAFVGIGMGATDTGQQMVDDFYFDKLNTPLLDVYGEHDFLSVMGLNLARKILIEFTDNPKSMQLEIPGADHYFKDKGSELTKAIADWLDTLE